MVSDCLCLSMSPTTWAPLRSPLQRAGAAPAPGGLLPPHMTLTPWPSTGPRQSGLSPGGSRSRSPQKRLSQTRRCLAHLSCDALRLFILFWGSGFCLYSLFKKNIILPSCEVRRGPKQREPHWGPTSDLSAPADIQLPAFMPQNHTITRPHQTFLITCS